jgi:hypothetical protein
MKGWLSWVAFGLVGCGSINDGGGSPDARGLDASSADAATSDATESDIPDADLPDGRPGDWVVIAPVEGINTPDNWEDTPSLSPSGREIYFSRRPSAMNGETFLYVAKRSSLTDDWSTPTKIDGTLNFTYPEVSPNGLELYAVQFQTLMRMTRNSTDDTWSPPAPLLQSTPMNRPSFSAEGRTLYYSAVDGLMPKGLKLRRRSAVETALWTSEEAVPAAPEGYRYHSISVDPTETFAVFSSLYGPSTAPKVAIMTRVDTTQPWSAFTPLETLSTIDAKSCDAASTSEIYCVTVRTIGTGSEKNLIRVTRAK